ncbi:hypothetical protein LCGC14_2413870 [marine sediment metagenome]|uniref:Uncharacterized protein n=1 Tax=marine sediment metagenome TaxID=412755 RepID=A0A0F9EL21_9ZZZZ
MTNCTNCKKEFNPDYISEVICTNCKTVCLFCKHNKHCQHNFDYQCKEVLDKLKIANSW